MNTQLSVTLPSGTMNLNINNSDIDVNELFGFACRQNPKRGFLFVSKVLGKHYPVKPNKILNTYKILADKIDSLILENDNPLFIGFAETATGLGCGIYDAWKQNNKQQDSLFIHTTRYNFNKAVALNFHEEHSHATAHIVFEPNEHKDFVYTSNTLVLIDDEITTGNTLKNFITAFVEKNINIKKVIIISLKNWMADESINNFVKLFNHLNIEFCSILTGNYNFNINKDYICESMPNVDSNNDYKDNVISNNHGRFGIQDIPEYDFKEMTKDLDLTKKTLVVGTGEFHYQPLLLASYLESLDVEVYYQSTTRSPISIGHDIKNKLSFIDNYNDKIPNFIYNVYPKQYEQVVICYETNSKNDFTLDEELNAYNIFFK